MFSNSNFKSSSTQHDGHSVNYLPGALGGVATLCLHLTATVTCQRARPSKYGLWLQNQGRQRPLNQSRGFKTSVNEPKGNFTRGLHLNC